MPTLPSAPTSPPPLLPTNNCQAKGRPYPSKNLPFGPGRHGDLVEEPALVFSSRMPRLPSVAYGFLQDLRSVHASPAWARNPPAFRQNKSAAQAVFFRRPRYAALHTLRCYFREPDDCAGAAAGATLRAPPTGPPPDRTDDEGPLHELEDELELGADPR